ncbi:response regulator [Candidatus Woesearchaeota archaeon]|nr:response regulator [Candidatus Woesearchaeota archaeon]
MTKRMILADDIEDFRHSISRIITALISDVEVEQVENGKKAVEKARCNGAYSLIMLDHTMGEMSGLEALKIIREFDTQTPIIIFSTDDIKEEALKLGATDYLSKSEFIKGKIDMGQVLRKYFE